MPSFVAIMFNNASKEAGCEHGRYRGFTNFGNEKTQAVACVSMWCNRMLVNVSTANFEHHQFIEFMCTVKQHSKFAVQTQPTDVSRSIDSKR